MTGNLYQRNYTIKEVSTGRILAECSQQSRSTAPPSAYVQSITPLKKYFVHVQPGVDLAFVASAVLMVEELYAEGGDVTVIGGGGGGGGRRRGRGGLSWHGNTRHNRGRLTHNSKPKRASHSKSHRSGGSRGRRGGRR